MQGIKPYNPPDKRVKPSFDLSSKVGKQESISETEKLDSSIQPIISSISKSNIERCINAITSFHTRHSKSAVIEKVALWLKDELEKNGQTDVTFHEYTESGFGLKNVVCNIKGDSDKVILVCAHYDSRMENLDDAQSRAPGAVDNASGMSVLLELSRIITSKLKFENTIQLVFFSGEEQGLWGSKHYAKFIKDNHVQLSKLINLDMVGYCPSSRRVCIIERDVGNVISTNDQGSEQSAQNVERIAKAYTNLHTKPGPIYDSDYMPFEELGFVVNGVYDGGAEEYPHYHTSADEAKQVNEEYVTEVTKMILVTLLKEGRVTNTI